MDMSPSPDTTASPVILFDGVCTLCSWSVQFVVRNDGRARFRFGSMQSEAGQALLSKHGLPVDTFDSLVLIEGEHVYQRSDAALRICTGLRAPWRWFGCLRVVPRPVRDAAYDLVARHRYRWFGRTESCLVPTGELEERFLS
jgi:predicted DCC family thiol-disulfide oxidoreductase YuxK